MKRKNSCLTKPSQRSWSIWLVASLVTLGLALPANAHGKSGSGGSTGCAGAGGKSFNVTSILADTDSSSLPFQVQSDTQGSYLTYTNSKTDSASSFIQAVSCDWVLDLTGSQLRTLKLSLGYIASSGAALPPGWPTDGSPVNVAARIISRCEDNASNPGISYGTMTFAGQTAQCGFFAAFSYAGGYYAIRMDTKYFPGTDWVQVTCTGATSNQCNAWTVGPIAPTLGGNTNPYTGQPAAITELQHQSSKGSLLGTSLGLYYVSFSATVTK